MSEDKGHELIPPPGLISDPPPEAKQIRNIYVTKDGKLKIVFEDTPTPS